MITGRRLQAFPFKLWRRAGFSADQLPSRLRPTLLADTQRLTLESPEIIGAIRRAVPTVDAYVDAFSERWRTDVLPLAVAAHDKGQYAGFGPVDYAEALTLYALIRERQPTNALELGFASGLSSLVLAGALEDNGAGLLTTVDVKDNGSVVEPFRRLQSDGRIEVHIADALGFVSDIADAKYEVTFSDALHTLMFNRDLARLLKERLPGAVHCYHEWSLSPATARREARFVSLKRNLATCGERQAFTEVFTDGYLHMGVPSTSGLGVVLPA